MITIDGVDLPTPSKFKITRADLDSGDTHRNELGYLQRDRVRQGLYKLELEFIGTSPEIHTIESAISPVAVNVTFPTPTGRITRRMYAGDRNGPEMVKNDKVTDKIYWRLSFNLIEY